MKRLLAVLALALTAASASAHEPPLVDIIEQVRPSVVGVGTVRPARRPLAKNPPVQFKGTGFVVADGLKVVTNFHVLPAELDTDNQETLAVFTGRGKNSVTRPATLLRADARHDLALLAIDGEPLPVMALAAAGSAREGQPIAFTGFPIGVVLGLYPVTHRGIISVITPVVIPALSSSQLTAAQIKRVRSPIDVYQLDAVAYPGNSGSAVYDAASGRVIGVLNSVLIKETKEAVLEKPSGISYAIPVRHVHRLLAE
jgi:S1-C subfamily serine protease